MIDSPHMDAGWVMAIYAPVLVKATIGLICLSGMGASFLGHARYDALAVRAYLVIAGSMFLGVTASGLLFELISSQTLEPEAAILIVETYVPACFLLGVSVALSWSVREGARVGKKIVARNSERSSWHWLASVVFVFSSVQALSICLPQFCPAQKLTIDYLSYARLSGVWTYLLGHPRKSCIDELRDRGKKAIAGVAMALEIARGWDMPRTGPSVESRMVLEKDSKRGAISQHSIGGEVLGPFINLFELIGGFPCEIGRRALWGWCADATKPYRLRIHAAGLLLFTFHDENVVGALVDLTTCYSFTNRGAEMHLIKLLRCPAGVPYLRSMIACSCHGRHKQLLAAWALSSMRDNESKASIQKLIPCSSDDWSVMESDAWQGVLDYGRTLFEEASKQLANNQVTTVALE